MKIVIQNDGRNITLRLPSALIFSKGSVWLANTLGRKYAPEAMSDIPPEALAALCAEFRRMKKRYGSWELVDVSAADGARVSVIL